MIGTILRVRAHQRIAWIVDKDGTKYFSHFTSFLDRPLGHICHIQEGSEVEFDVVENHDTQRNLNASAVNISFLNPLDVTFPTEAVESVVYTWNGRYGFARNAACSCPHIFVLLKEFITAEEYLVDEYLHEGSRLISNLQDSPEKQNATAKLIELFQPEGFDASILQNM